MEISPGKNDYIVHRLHKSIDIHFIDWKVLKNQHGFVLEKMAET